MSTMTSERRAVRRRTLWLVVLAIAGVALLSVLVPLQTRFSGTPLPIAMILGAGICAAPVAAVGYPRSAITAFCLASFALPLFGAASRDAAWPWPWSVPAMIAFTLLALVVTAVHGWRLGLVLWTAGNVGSLVVLAILPGAVTVGAATADLVVTASLSAAALLVGLLLAGRIRIGEELNRSLELAALEQSRRALVEERTRIARELHDVVAHGMSVIQVQASTARYRVPGLPDEAAAEFDDIAASARRSLAEMRRLLGVLRTEDQEQELAPQQGVADIPDLVEGIRRAGADVRLEVSATAPAPPSVEITAFRIVQEALSNAVRHAPGSAVEVEVDDAGGAVRIRVHDDGAPSSALSPGGTPAGGHGLRGMRERVSLVGGSLTAGPDPAGGWTVTALIPWAATGEEVA
jgi:signal transduction histidine kinase